MKLQLNRTMMVMVPCNDAAVTVASYLCTAAAESDDGDAPALPAARAAPPAAPHAAPPAAPNVSPPEVWSDAVMNWRHPLSFVFILNGPMTYWHPNPDNRVVCEFLKKVPRTGPQAGSRAVNRDDSRRSQRSEARNEERADVTAQNEELLQTLRASRCALAAVLVISSLIFHREAQTSAASDANQLMRLQLQQNEARALAETAAASQANELRRLQLQLQLAQQATASGTAHILQMQTSLNVLKDLALSDEQAAKKKKMENDLAEKCLAVANALPDPLAAISAQLNLLSPAHAPTVLRSSAPPQQLASVAGGGARNNLHPQFHAAR